MKKREYRTRGQSALMGSARAFRRAPGIFRPVPLTLPAAAFGLAGGLAILGCHLVPDGLSGGSFGPRASLRPPAPRHLTAQFAICEATVGLSDAHNQP